MNSTTTNDCSATEVSVVLPQDGSARCQYRFSNGKRCQLPGLESQSGFCSRHFRPLALSFPSSPNDFEDLSADLLPELNEFSSGEDIQKFLARLVIQVTRGRVSPRRAAVLGYLTNAPFSSRHGPGIRKRAPAIHLRPPAPQTRLSRGPERAIANLHALRSATPARRRSPGFVPGVRLVPAIVTA